MHGLIFEISIWSLAGSTRYLKRPNCLATIKSNQVVSQFARSTTRSLRTSFPKEGTWPSAPVMTRSSPHYAPCSKERRCTSYPASRTGLFRRRKEQRILYRTRNMPTTTGIEVRRNWSSSELKQPNHVFSRQSQTFPRCVVYDDLNWAQTSLPTVKHCRTVIKLRIREIEFLGFFTRPLPYIYHWFTCRPSLGEL